MANVKWTTNQKKAIDARNSNILVSAAAGSGKTAVLTERVISRITDKNNPINIDRLLIVTFTNAAAEEMRQRIQKKLWELIAKNPNDEHLQRQVLLVDSAQISTIHSFCIELLRENFESLGLSAEFTIADEKDLSVMQSNLVRELIDIYYEQNNSDFLKLVELISASKNDKKLEDSILTLYSFLRNHPFYDVWVARAISSYNNAFGIEDSSWFKLINGYILDATEYMEQIIEIAKNKMSFDSQIEDAYTEVLEKDEKNIKSIKKAVEGGRWDDMSRSVLNIVFDRMPTIKGCKNAPLKDEVLALRKEIKDTVKKLGEQIFIITSDVYNDDNTYIQPLIKTLFDMVMDFDGMYSNEKLKNNELDFNDLEHYALKLLYRHCEDGYELTDIAESLKNMYDEMLIDEYQDTNETQEMIFKALENNNLFFVGDVKQSIYRFRQARPENFLYKKNTYADYGTGEKNSKIILSENFRTRREATEVVNFICERIFNKTVGEMEYLAEDRLNSSGKFDYSVEKPVELMIVDEAQIKDATKYENLQAEAVAQKIYSMLNGHLQIEYTQDDVIKTRDVNPSDICILMRSRTKASQYVDALARLNINAISDASGEYLSSYEVAPIISYLKVLINPMLNFEMCETLSSYLYGFSTEILAELRIDKNKSVYSVLIEKSKDDKYEYSSDIRDFLRDYSLLRKEMVNRRASEIIQIIYTLTSAENKVNVLTNGEARVANLHLLTQYAESYSKGYNIDSFVNYIYSMEDAGCDLEPAKLSSSDSVTIMNIHKSKGLEFPIVILAETETRFNEIDLREPVILNAEYGAAFRIKNTKDMIQHKTLPFISLSIENRRAMLSEELRILYVALTRAKQYLIISAEDKNGNKIRRAMLDSNISPWRIRNSTSMYDWIIMALTHHSEFSLYFNENDELSVDTSKKVSTLKCSVFEIENIGEEKEENIKAKIVSNEEKKAHLKTNMLWKYPYEKETITPIKFSVSELSHDKYEEKYLFNRKPKVFKNEALTATDKGTAMHKFMQYVDYKNLPDNIDEELERMLNKQFLSESEVKSISRDRVYEMFTSDFGKRILNARAVRREMRFMYKYSRAELIKIIGENDSIGESTVIQGASDLILFEDDGIVLIDYKTDKAKQESELIDKYKIQLELYADILERILSKRVKEKVIYSFTLNTPIYL